MEYLLGNKDLLSLESSRAKDGEEWPEKRRVFVAPSLASVSARWRRNVVASLRRAESPESRESSRAKDGETA